MKKGNWLTVKAIEYESNHVSIDGSTVNPQENTATWIEMFQKWPKKVPSQDVLNLKAQVDPNYVTKMPFHSITAPPHPFA